MAKIGKKISKISPSAGKHSSDRPGLIAKACEGLVYISETDSPIIPFSGPAAESVSPGSAAAASGVEYREPVETVSLPAFFARLTAEKDWFSTEEKRIAARFRELQAALEKELTGISVYRFGRIQVDIVVAGLDKNSCIRGVRTRSVET
jgi:hypothetical protein